MNWLVLNLPFMVLATAMILGIMAVGLYVDYRKEEAKAAATDRHPSVVNKVHAANQEKVS
ncbi:MAG: hypothetical protein M0Z91_10535 [Actinomycetota bacterium]|nr:hypothetical protein [Actinomycetota bacterium]